MKKAKVSVKTKSKSGPKSSYHHDDLRAELVSAALKFMKNNRAEDLSLRELARSLGVSHMAPYRHFATKEDLLAAIIEDGFHRLSAMFDGAKLSAEDSFQDIFAFFGKAYIRFFVQNSDQARLMFSGLLCDPEKHKAAHEAGQGTFNRLIQLIEFGQKQGHINKKDNPYMLGLMIWSSVHGTAMLMLENQFSMIDKAPEVQIDVFVNFMTEKMLSGLKLSLN